MYDTICAISTSPSSAISIIRVSGDNAIEITNKIFKGKDLNKVNSHTINYGFIHDNEEIIDEVLVSVMKKPKTYTKEDVVEINTHGGIAPTNKTLELLLINGARIAEPGEFTKRAYLNGRIDLLEAEAIMDMINSKTEKERNMAINQIKGKTSNLIDDLRSDLIELISNINVNIDYPEYDDIEEITNNKTIPILKKVKEKAEIILKESKNGQMIKDGISTTIIGKPNVGKSSLLNALLEEEKAIVTNIPGTTTDIVEGEILINGIKLNLKDTAGIRTSKNEIERIGIKKSKESIKNSDLILYMLNNNEEINKETIELLKTIKDKNYLILINKIDLENKLDLNKLDIDKDKIIFLSIVNNQGIDKLKERIIKMFSINEIIQKEAIYLSDIRSISILKSSLNKINSLLDNINNIPIDMIEMELKIIWEEIGKINGKTYEEELLDEMFKRFCLGK